MSEFQLTRCVTVLRQGGVVAHATEGVWGLACDPFNPAAVARVIELKGRSERRGFILIAGHAGEFSDELSALNETQRKQVLTSWPGAMTHIVPNRSYPIWVSPHRNQLGVDQRREATVAVRVTGHPQAQALARRFGGALLSTSANPSGQPAATSQLRVQHYFSGGLDYVLPGQVLVPGAASGIRDAVTGHWIRRPQRTQANASPAQICDAANAARDPQ